MKKIDLTIIIYIALIFWKIFIPGPRAASDFQIISPDTLKISFSLPIAWSDRWAEGMGEYGVGTLWSWPLDFLYGLGGILGIDFWILERILGIFPAIILAYFGIDRLLNYINISGWGKRLGIIFYIINSYFLLLLDGGQLNLALAYGVLPIAFVFFKEAIEKYSVRNSIKFGLTTILISVFDIRIIFILFLLIIIDFLLSIFFLLRKGLKYAEISEYLFTILQLGIITLLTLLLIHAYWIIPSIFSQSPTLPSTYARPSQLSALSFANIGHAILLLQPHWYENIFGKITQLKFDFTLIPILVFLSPILKKNDRRVAFWIIVALVGIFLSKGINSPSYGINFWLFTNIPGFSFFRDPTKFFFLICLSYSILISITVSKLQKKWGKFLPILILIYFFWIVRPVYLGQLSGILGTQLYEKEYSKLSQFLKSDQEFSRVFWIGAKPPLSFTSPVHPSVEAVRFAQKRPFATGIVGSYETFNFLREASYIGQLLDVSGVGYIVNPFLDPKRKDLSFDDIRYYYIFNNQLSSLPYLSKEKTIDIPIFKAKEHQPQMFLAPNTWWIIGSDDLYKNIGDNLKLSKNGLIFADEYAGFGERLKELPEAGIVLNNKGPLDLAASFIKSDSFVSLAVKLNFQPDQSGWWKREAVDFVWLKNFLLEKYGIENQDFDLGMGWAIGEGNLKLKVQSEKIKKDEMLLARVLESTRSGSLKFYQDNKLIGQINTKQEGNNIRWFEVGKILGNNQIVIESEGDINVVNALAFIDKNKLEEYKNIASDLNKNGRIVVLEKIDDYNNEAEAKFEKINSTKYKVIISNLKKPVMLVFSESFDNFWELNGRKALPVYSLLNSFRIDKDGVYELDYKPQKYVNIGLIISGLTVIMLFILWQLGKEKS